MSVPIAARFSAVPVVSGRKYSFQYTLQPGAQFPADSWEGQREFQRAHFDSILAGLKATKDRLGYYETYGVITLAYIRNKDQFTVLDGQHRLRAYEVLISPVTFTVDVIAVDNSDEVATLFETLNNTVRLTLQERRPYAEIAQFTELFTRSMTNLGWCRETKTAQGPMLPQFNKAKLAAWIEDGKDILTIFSESVSVKDKAELILRAVKTVNDDAEQWVLVAPEYFDRAKIGNAWDKMFIRARGIKPPLFWPLLGGNILSHVTDLFRENWEAMGIDAAYFTTEFIRGNEDT